MSGGGGSRVPIPNNVRKVIQDIREISGKQHSDDDIYAVLKECSMDPNETAQKLLYLGLNLSSHSPSLAQSLKTMSGGGGSRVPIPNNVRKVIQDIREISGKQHSDDDIYAVLKECSMDPNETAQKLLYLDTFHEVRRRRDRKKEVLSSRASEDSRSKQGGQGRGGRSASGGYSSNFSDGGGGRNAAIRKEIGVSHIAEKSYTPSTQPALQKTKDNAESQVTRVSAVAANSPTPANQSNGSASHGSTGQSLMGSVASVCKSSDVDDFCKEENSQHHAAVAAVSSHIQTFNPVTRIDQGMSLSSSDQLPISASSVSSVYSSLDPVLAPSISQNPAVGGVINGEVEIHQLADEFHHVKGNKVVLHEVGEFPESKSERSGSLNSTSKKRTPNNSNEAEENQLSETSQPSSSSSNNGSMRSSSSCGNQEPSADLKQHVIFPNHFKVPEALTSSLTFGSFDTVFVRREGSSRTGSDNSTSPALQLSQGSDETATSSASSTLPDRPDYTQIPSYLVEKPPVSEVNAISSADPKGDQPKQEVVLASECTPISTIQNTQNYGLNFMPTMVGTQQVQSDGAEPQVQETTPLPNFVSANSHAVSSPSSTPPLQSAIPVSPQSVSIVRPPYPTSFFPYGPYYPPIYVSPIHQYLSHNGFPQQPSAGNMYLPAAAAGIKFPLPQFKAGANTGNVTHIGIPSGSFISPPVGYAPSPTATNNSTGNEDLPVSQFKENHSFTTGQLSEGSAVWIPAPPAQDISSLQLSSLYNLTPQGNLTFSPTQAGHGAFAGIYQPGQPVASSSTILQQSQALAGAVENVGPPSGVYQQPQHAQVNWSSNF